ncbi:aldo/keto reductase [Methanobrevibacter sp.]
MEYKKLNNNEKLPFVSYGVYEIDPKDTKNAVLNALNRGYTAIDGAQVYYNEKEVGQAINESEIPREDIFLTSKNWVSNSGYDKTIKAVNKSLDDLQTDYIDLLLIHQPFGDYYGSYRALQDLQKDGSVLSIGVSNFDSARLVDLTMNFDIVPQVNQVETTPYFQQYEANEIMNKLGVAHQSWGPLSEGLDGLFKKPVLLEIAEKYDKSPVQVIFRWLVDRDIPFSCRSVKTERMEENIDIFDFKLNKNDIKKIKELDEGESPFNDYNDPETAEEFNSEII